MLIRSIAVLFFSSFFMLACQQGSSAPQASSPADIKFSTNAAFAIVGPIVTDCTFNNTAVIDGISITAYQNSSVQFGISCVSELRTCNSGFLSGSYNYASCSVNSPASCLFNGQTIAHGSSIEAYPVSSVDLGLECIFEMRTCNNGVLSGSNQYASCSINLPASCLFNGQTITSGQSTSAYLRSTVPFGELCSVETRYCINGALSGSNQFGSCVVDQPASCLFNGQTISDGQTVNAFLNSSVSFGNLCQGEVRVCKNGVLSGANQYASCVIDQAASCLFNGQTIVDGSSITAYQSSNSNSGELCVAQERFCNNGQLAGSYQFASCSIDQPASCLFNGQTIANTTLVTAFLTSSVSFGGTCSSELRECKNGILTGTNIFANCQLGSPASCLFEGQTISHGQTVIAYQTSSVSSGQLCTSEIKTCSNGSLSGLFTFSNCIVQNSDPDDNEKDKYCNKQRIEKKNHDDEDTQDKNDESDKHRDVSKHSDNGLHLGWYKEKHKEHFDCGKHLGWYKEKKKIKNKCSDKDNKNNKKK